MASNIDKLIGYKIYGFSVEKRHREVYSINSPDIDNIYIDSDNPAILVDGGGTGVLMPLELVGETFFTKEEYFNFFYVWKKEV